jgi:hypothetical protein
MGTVTRIHPERAGFTPEQGNRNTNAISPLDRPYTEQLGYFANDPGRLSIEIRLRLGELADDVDRLDRDLNGGTSAIQDDCDAVRALARELGSRGQLEQPQAPLAS